MKSFCVYEHIFPNGKRYIGISSNAEMRWRNGKGYEKQGKIAKAIDKYGWENVRHNIIVNGVSKDQAGMLEQYLIATLDTIRSGYNTAIGGENINSTYIDSHVLAMINAAKKYGVKRQIVFPNGTIDPAEIAYSDRYDKDAAEFWNEAATAVEKKHGGMSPTDALEVARFWHYIGQYFILWSLHESGEDVSEWHEISFERANFDYLFGSGVTGDEF